MNRKRAMIRNLRQAGVVILTKEHEMKELIFTERAEKWLSFMVIQALQQIYIHGELQIKHKRATKILLQQNGFDPNTGHCTLDGLDEWGE